MKKIRKSADTPKLLEEYQNKYPDASWGQLKNEARAVYDKLCVDLEADQCGLCAYCELKAFKPEFSLQVEHIVAKSYQDSACKWALHWPNMLAVCQGGSQLTKDKDRYLEPLRVNLSCDQHKNHLVISGSLSEDSRGFIVNPLDLPALPPLVAVLHDGSLIPHTDSCSQVEITPNAYSTTKELIDKSIEYLNLNCPRLCLARREASKNVNNELKKSRPDSRCRKFLALNNERRRQFFTVYRCRLGKAAETYLAESGFQG